MNPDHRWLRLIPAIAAAVALGHSARSEEASRLRIARNLRDRAVARLKKARFSGSDRAAGQRPAIRSLMAARGMLEQYPEPRPGEVEQELLNVNSLIYWARKTMPAVAGAVADAPSPASPSPESREETARARFDDARAYAERNPDSPFVIAVRYFEVADRFRGTELSLEAQRLSLKYQRRARAGAADDPAGPVETAPGEEAGDAPGEGEAPAGGLGRELTLPEEAEQTAEAIRRAVRAGVAEGRHETIHIEFGRGSKRAKVTGADEDGIQLSLTGVTTPMAWEKVDAKRFYFLGRGYLLRPGGSAKDDARTRLRLARFCIAKGLLAEAQNELTKILTAEPAMRADDVLLATDGLLREGRERGPDSPEAAKPAPRRRVAPRAAKVSRKRELVACHKCGGTGVMHWMTCPQCGKSTKAGYLNMGDHYAVCNRCKGRGKLPGIRCNVCGGRGKIDPDRPPKRERRIPTGYASCYGCGGTGVTDWLECRQCKFSDFPGYCFFGDYYSPCNRCKGRGKLPGIQCQQCGGRGIVKEGR